MVSWPDNEELLGWQDRTRVSDAVIPWKPRALTHAEWPPDYQGVYQWRIRTLTALRNNPSALISAKAYYSTRPAEFIQHWMDTYNPRKSVSKWMPFVFFWRQHEFIEFLEELRADEANGLVEKCRDVGATWLACAYSIWGWLFVPGFSVGWGSRKQDLVDTIGDPDSIFEKMRLLVRRLPDVFLPDGFKPREHATFTKMLNPENGANITGESGDQIGRGGRKTIYLKDESAFYERAELIEGALGDNTNIQIDISTVNGLGNVFHRRRESGKDWSHGCIIDPGETRVFVFDWRHHPEKDEEWYEMRRAKAEREGMQHIFASEVDRDYSAAIANRIIDMPWIMAAIDAHIHIPYLAAMPIPDVWGAGLDVADEGLDVNALAIRQWIILRSVDQWGQRDTGTTTRRAIIAVRPYKNIRLQYDCIGVGAGVKSEYNTLVDDPNISLNGVRLMPWNAGAAVINPFDHVIPNDYESALNKDFYGNFKAQAWWALRNRFYKTWRARTYGEVYPADELISLDGRIPLLHAVTKELAQPARAESSGLRTIVDKKPKGTKSPNLADAIVQTFFPVPENDGVAITGGYSG